MKVRIGICPRCGINSISQLIVIKTKNKEIEVCESCAKYLKEDNCKKFDKENNFPPKGPEFLCG